MPIHCSCLASAPKWPRSVVATSPAIWRTFRSSTPACPISAAASKPSGTCAMAGETIAKQTWTVGGYTLSGDVKTLTYECNVSVKAGAFGGCNLASSEVAGLC